MKYIDADLLRKESERLRKLLEDHNYYLDNSEQSVGYANALLDIENFLDTLSEEPNKSLEEAAEEYTQKMLESWRFDSTGCRPPRESFKAGAEWQKSQMLKDAVESEAEELYNDGESQCTVSAGTYFKPGDKVYVLKAEED